MTDITVPTLGESITEATVGQWLKAKGDTVKKDDVLVELETDKVSVEVSATEDGVLGEILAQPGDTVEIGALLGRLEGGAGGAKPAAAAAPAKKEEEEKPAAAPAASGGGSTDIVVPVMGESVAEGTLSTFLKQPGDAVKKDETIAEIETDKVALEVPAPADGVIAEWTVSEGTSVTPGSVIGRVSASGADASSKPAAAPAPKAAPAAASDERPVAPSVRRISAEAGVDPQNIPGTGRDGRATKADAMAYVNAPKAPAAAPAPSAPRETGPREERVRMTRLRQTIARRLKEAQDTAAMLTTFNDVDMGAIMDLRKKHQESFVAKHGIKLGFMSFFVKACVNALKEVPAVNAEIDGQDIIYKNFYDIGVAVGTEKGLVVPVVRDSDDLPQSGVLGMHRIEQRPVAVNGEVKIRPMMYLALSYDHRIVDGKEAVTFLVRVKEALEDPERMLLEV